MHARPFGLLAMAMLMLGAAACSDARAKQHFDDEPEESGDDTGAGTGSEQGIAKNAAIGETTTGGGGGTTSGTTSTPTADPSANDATAADLDVTLDKKTLDVDLFQKATLTVTVTPKNKFSGAVTLSASGLPGATKATFTPATVNVSAGSPATATLEISGADTSGSVAAKITATAGSEMPSAGLALNVKPHITLTIPLGVQNKPNAFGVGNLAVKVPDLGTQSPLVVTVVNKDAAGHEIHAGGTTGCNHGNAPIPQNGSEDRKLTATGKCSAYIHGMDGTNPSTVITISK